MNNKPPVLELHDVYARYGTVSALERVSLTVGAGENENLIGAHGSGKTTVLKVICGLLSAADGEI